MLLNGYVIKQAGLSLKKRPGFVATVIVTMGTTLGALICVLTLAYLLLFQPLPYPEQDRLYQVEYTLQNNVGIEESNFFNFNSLLKLYEENQAFDQSAFVFYAQNVITSLPQQPTVPVAFTTPELMDMLNVPMELGRVFDEREAIDTEHQVVILDYDTWQNEFNGDADILSTKIDFKGRNYQIIGVTAKDFIEPQIFRQGVNTGVWFPWDFHLAQAKETNGNADNRWFFFAKLKTEYTAEQAAQIITPDMSELWENNPNASGVAKDWIVVMFLHPLSEVLLGESANSVYFLLAGVIGLVIIASANITNLFVSRTAEQQSTLAIHAALGAKKSQLLRAIFAESSLLMFAAIFLALAISTGGFYLMQTYLDELLPRVAELGINAITLGAAIGFAGLAALFFAYISGKMINYRALNTQLQSSGKGTGIQVSKTTRQFLIISQVAIAMVLVFANLSLFKTAFDEINTEPGFTIENTYHASFSVSSPTFPDPEIVMPIMRDLERQLLSLPQVEQVDISWSPLRGFFNFFGVDPRTNEQVRMEGRPVGEQYFEMIEQPLITGDYFSKADINDGLDVGIINESLAKELAPDGNALGLTMLFGEDTHTVIGIVKDVIYPGEVTSSNRWYFPSQGGGGATKMNIKTLPGQTISRVEVVDAIQAVTPLYALYGLELLTETKDSLLFSQYTTAVTTAVLAIITLFLAAIGLYGILSYGTQMRRFELGTRMAIGAKGSDLIWLIIKENTSVIIFGVLLSIALLLGLYIGINNILASYISLTLLPLYFVTLVAITLLSLFACYWPLRQYITQPAIHSLRGAE